MRFLLLILFSVALAGCNDDKTPNVSITTVGFQNNDGPGTFGAIASWTDNKIKSVMDDLGIISCGFVSGSDVYHGGIAADGGGERRPAFWKNGIRTILADSGNVTAICAANGNVYCAGYVIKNKIRIPVYWTNTDTTHIKTLGDTDTWLIAVQGTDVYVVGKDKGRQVEGQNVAVTTIWQDGEERYGFNLEGTNSTISAITFSGSDLYAAGVSHLGTYLWHGGKFAELDHKTSESYIPYPQSIFVDGSDVYVATTKLSYDSVAYGAVYWKNDIPTALSGSREAVSIKVVNSDVYVLGYSYNTVSNGVGPPAIWKNDSQSNLETPFDWTYAVFDFSVHN
jgi:hypothetical protein